MGKVLCSTGALLGRPNGRNFSLLPELEKQLQCDGLELMFYDTWYNQTEMLLSILQQLQKPICVFHAEKNICSKLASGNPEEVALALQQFTENCRIAAEIHAEKMVFHLWDGWMNDQQIIAVLRHYPTLKAIADQHAVLLTIENIVTNENDPLYYCRMLCSQCPDVSFTYDTKMAAFHCQENALFVPENAAVTSRIRHLHINDYGGGYKEWPKFKTLHIGDGHVDFHSLFKYLPSIHYDGDFTTEATSFDSTGRIDINKLNCTLATLKKYTQE